MPAESFLTCVAQAVSINPAKNIAKNIFLVVVKNTAKRPLEMEGEAVDPEEAEKALESNSVVNDLPKDFYISSLTDFVPKVILVAYEEEYESFEKVSFSFIKKGKERLAKGGTISSDLNLENFSE